MKFQNLYVTDGDTEINITFKFILSVCFRKQNYKEQYLNSILKDDFFNKKRERERERERERLN